MATYPMCSGNVISKIRGKYELLWFPDPVDVELTMTVVGPVLVSVPHPAAPAAKP